MGSAAAMRRSTVWIGCMWTLSVLASSSTAPFALTAAPATNFAGPGVRADAARLAATVGLEPRLGARLPLDAVFVDEQGEARTLGSALTGTKAIVLLPGYYRCPNLCGLTLHGVLEALVEGSMLEDVRVLRVSIDPEVGPEDARAHALVDRVQAAALLDAARRMSTSSAAVSRALVDAPARGERAVDRQYQQSRFADRPANDSTPAIDLQAFVGSRPAIGALTQAIGYRYAADPASPSDRPSSSDAEGSRWIHVAGFVVVTPEGRITKVFDGVRFDPAQLRLALVDAADGRIGSWGDRLRLVCAHLESASSQLAPLVLGGVRVLGLSSALLLGLWIWRHRRGPIRHEARRP
jgi:protein SCO1/2